MFNLLILSIRGFLAAVRSRREVALENVVLRHQLQVALRTNPSPRLRSEDRILWVWLSRLWPGWRQHLAIVRPESVLRWHRKGWRLYWTWRSNARIGRPRLSADVRDLIGTMTRENRLWGTERVRGELLKLGIVVSNRSIRRYRWRKPSPLGPQSWRTFRTNELQGIWAADLLVVQTIAFRTLYVLFFVRHERRELIYLNVTANPTAAWIWRQLLEAIPWGRQPAHLIHDRDASYGGDFDRHLGRLGITGVRTPPRSPRANAVAERLVGSIRREVLDHVIVIGEGHLRALLTEFLDYYNHDRPHRTLSLASPLPRQRGGSGGVVARPVFGGLHHVYARAA